MTDALAIYNRLSVDEQDSVRLLTVEDLIAIAEQLTPQQVKEHLLGSIRQTFQDKSWRVRYMVANTFVKVSKVILRFDFDYNFFVFKARRVRRPRYCSG